MPKLDFVAQELRRIAPNAPAPEGGTTHDGRRAFFRAAALLDDLHVLEAASKKVKH